MIPNPKFFRDMGMASIIAGVILLALSHITRWFS